MNKLSNTIKLPWVSPHESTSSISIGHLLTPVVLSLITIKYRTKNLILGFSNNLNPEKTKILSPPTMCRSEFFSALRSPPRIWSPSFWWRNNSYWWWVQSINPNICSSMPTSHLPHQRMLLYQSAHEKSQIFFKL